MNPAAKPIRVLVLEDEAGMNRGIAFSLERSGFEVVQAYSLRDAYRAYDANPAEIYICDITLPDGSGLDFVKKIRSAPTTQPPYIICLTALDTETDFVLGYEAGADDYIAKPFSLSVLMLKLEAHVKRVGLRGAEAMTAPRAADCLTSGGICLNTARMEVTLDGTPVPLTKNEMKLLHAFMRNPQQLLSRKQLLEQAFDCYDQFLDKNTLAVNISRLRDKLGDSAQNPSYIKNVRGLGYIWMKDT